MSIDPRTYKGTRRLGEGGGGGEGWRGVVDATPIRFFRVFFERIKCFSTSHFQQMFVHPSPYFETSLVWSVAMVTRYDDISSRLSSHFWVKIHLFSTSFNNKGKSCG